ncbi:hypothetical protein CIB48_g5117 [Xylaria polymorpha]|nr:hypothetical protein CIB48_g5117 [Xylaria polymorpha]
MPPKKRGRPAASQPEPEPEPAVSDDNASNRSNQDEISDSGSDADQSGRETEFKFFNTTFSTFRVSPLYIARNNLTPAGLETLSRRLRDTLVGDVVRGVQVGLEGDNATLGRLGGLERVEWRECSLAGIIPSLAEEDANGRRQKGRRGAARPRHLLCLELEYERATFSALLLPSLDEKETHRIDDDDDGSLLRDRPSWTQNSTNPRNKSKERGKDDDDDDDDAAATTASFTTLPPPLNPDAGRAQERRTRSLIRSWERWIGTGGTRQKALSKDVALTLGFHLEPPAISAAAAAADEPQPAAPPVSLGLKTIDIVVPASEVHRFLRAGRITTDAKPKKRPHHSDSSSSPSEERIRRRRRRKLGGGLDEEGWWWMTTPNITESESESETLPQPFTAALATYLSHHMALDLFHPGGARAARTMRRLCAVRGARQGLRAPSSGRPAEAERWGVGGGGQWRQ